MAPTGSDMINWKGRAASLTSSNGDELSNMLCPVMIQGGDDIPFLIFEWTHSDSVDETLKELGKLCDSDGPLPFLGLVDYNPASRPHVTFYRSDNKGLMPLAEGNIYHLGELKHSRFADDLRDMVNTITKNIPTSDMRKPGLMMTSNMNKSGQDSEVQGLLHENNFRERTPESNEQADVPNQNSSPLDELVEPRRFID
ncbi:hypothetical protein AJ79_08120 [Helicocarpus griseus UAMH5409]|uniref:Uncharacterized protein n=1 Tax=Helicocarpus griseus UAMH5409 TaxID=1447875 RepID=A0A2B7WVU3_9EURO|nr:hypothetical protein AJ79_08120 [Helicocarpus griseus UAMH5409]